MKHRLQASIQWTLSSRVNSAQEIVLNAVDLDIVRIQSTGHDLNTEYDGQLLTIRWESAIATGEEVTVQIDYIVDSPIAGCYFGGPSPAMKDRGYWMATDHETTRARYWLPCIDHSNVRTTWDIHITHQTDHTAISAGYLVSTTSIDEQTSCSHWKQDQLCPAYLLALIVGEYERVDFEPLRDIPISGFAPKGNSREDIERAFEPTKALIEFAESFLGPLPWAKYHQFAAPGIGGAMENISLVSWDSRLLFDENMHKDLGFLFDQINLHELAHTWFGDLVVCRDYAHVWLKESWATFMETVWIEHKHSIERHHEEIVSQRELYFKEVNTKYSRPIMTRVFDDAWKMYDMHLYPGGSARINMLRNKVGNDNFWAATRDYINTYAQSVVETDDFRRMVEKHSGQSLAHFFDQWFCRAGYPKVTITQNHFSDTNVLRLKINQKIVGGQKNDAPFVFDLDIAVEDSVGHWTEHTVHIDDVHSTFRFPAESSPKQIVIDPHCIAVSEIDFDPGLSMNQMGYETSPFWHGRLQSGRNLIKSGSTLALRTVDKFYQDQHVGIRERLAQAMSTCKNPKTEQILLGWLSSETEAQPQAAIITSLSSQRSLETAECLLSFIENCSNSHRTRGIALTSFAQMGRFCRDEVLFRYVQHDGWRHSIRSAAIQSLKHRPSDQALNHLCNVVIDPQEEFRTRASACGALVACAKRISKTAEQDAKEVLIQVLADAHPTVRLSAVGALKALGHRDSIPHIRGVQSQIPVQNSPDIMRAIKACSKGTEQSSTQSFIKRLESLEEENLSLKQSLQEIKAQLNLSKE
jgi:aminopeptidase N